ncbi:MAG: hypothetical protein M1820_002029 [Bogoriella megaspora]|nr:MAG: hypothetical protein M1820_002029 [Bogoriella megaspora]
MMMEAEAQLYFETSPPKVGISGGFRNSPKVLRLEQSQSLLYQHLQTQFISFFQSLQLLPSPSTPTPTNPNTPSKPQLNLHIKMKTFTTTLLALLTTALTLTSAAPTPTNAATTQATATINLIFDLASAETRQVDVVVGTQIDTDFNIEAAQIQTVEDANGNAIANQDGVVCSATRDFSSNVAGTFTVDREAVFENGRKVEITSISCEFQ